MRHTFPILLLALGLACGGSSSTSTNTPPVQDPPKPPSSIPVGTYLPTPKVGVAGFATDAQSMQSVLVQAPLGAGCFELDGWAFCRQNTPIAVEPDGTLRADPGDRLIDKAGNSVPLQLQGKLIGNRLVGTVNGIAFDWTATGLMAMSQPMDLASRAGTYVGTLNNRGVASKIVLSPVPGNPNNGNVRGDWFASMEDLQAGDKILGHYVGSYYYWGGDDTHTKNAYRICTTFQTTYLYGGSAKDWPGGCEGILYFSQDGQTMTILSGHPDNPDLGGGQWSGVFTKQ